jgi:hypothetical protein
LLDGVFVCNGLALMYLSGAKAGIELVAWIAALKRCATQKQRQSRIKVKKRNQKQINLKSSGEECPLHTGIATG